MRSPAAQQFFANAPITDATLRHFRRCNRELVKRCVGKVLCRTLQTSGNRAMEMSVEARGNEAPSALSTTVCAPRAAAESEHRIDEAALCDSLDLN